MRSVGGHGLTGPGVRRVCLSVKRPLVDSKDELIQIEWNVGCTDLTRSLSKACFTVGRVDACWGLASLTLVPKQPGPAHGCFGSF